MIENMSWPKGIVISFILFILFIGSMVYIMMKEDISLVAENYYEQELVYQQQLSRKNNALMLDKKPVVRIREGKYLEIAFPYESRLEGGKVQLFRPSAKKFDEQFTFTSLTDNRLLYEVKNHLSGACRIRIWWKMNDKEYFWEEFAVI